MKLRPEETGRETDAAPLEANKYPQLAEARPDTIDDTRRALLKGLLATVVVGTGWAGCGTFHQTAKKEKKYEEDPRYQQLMQKLYETVFVTEFTLKLIRNHAKKTLPTHDPIKIFNFGERFKERSEYIEKEFEKLNEYCDDFVGETQTTDPDLAEEVKDRLEEIRKNLATQLSALFDEYVSVCDGLIPKVNEDTFEQEVLEQEGATLVFLSMEWCPQCKLVTPFVAEFGEQAKQAVRVKKAILSTEDRKDVNTGIISHLLKKGAMPTVMPSFILFINGNPATIHIGVFNSAEEIREFVMQGMKDSLQDPVPEEPIKPNKNPIEI